MGWWSRGFCLFVFSVFLSPIATAQEVLIVGSGGWKSCKNGIRAQFIGRQLDNLVQDLRKASPHDRISVLRTCTDFKAAAWGVGFSFLYEGARGSVQGTVTPEGLAGLIQRYRVDRNDRVFLIGHSHGGWHSMVAASRMDTLDQIFTLEPVSAAHCDVRDYLQNRSKRLIKRRQHIVPGCRQAPTDVDHGRIAAVSRSGWNNYILSDGEPKGDIHSGAVSFASNLSYQIFQGDRSHHFLGLSPYIWQDICQKISSALGGGQAQCSAMQVDGEGNFVRFL